MIYYVIELFIISILIYLIIAISLIFWPAQPQKWSTSRTIKQMLDFLPSAKENMPSEALFFQARDGAKRLYRLYGKGKDLLIFFHGFSTDSRYLANFARGLSDKYDITVATLDMRGHGTYPIRRGDLDYVKQQEHDIVDLIKTLGQVLSFDKVYLGGHSSGGAMALRYASGSLGPPPAGLILVCPFIDYRAPTARAMSGAWATPRIARFIGIGMLNRIGIRLFNSMPVLRFSVPDEARDGSETTEYSWRLYKSITLNNWRKDISQIPCPILVVTAENDTIYRPEAYRQVFDNTDDVVVTLKNTTHFEAIMSEETSLVCAKWLELQGNT